jgi:hypothetical protein
MLPRAPPRLSSYVYLMFVYYKSIIGRLLLLLLLFLFGISETLHYSVFAPHLKIVPLLDMHQVLMLFAGMFTYLKPGKFSPNDFLNIV